MTAVDKYLCETDIKKLLQCSRCKRAPSGPPIYMCKTGHQECSACYEKHSQIVLVEETDGSTDTESESDPSKHICAICKDEVTKTRNLFAECLLSHLDLVKNNNKVDIHQMKMNVQETKVQANYVDCCYNIYGSPCQRYDTQNIPISSYDPQGYPRYQIPCTMPQYNYTVDPYVLAEPHSQIDYADPGVYYPEYDNTGFYNSNNRRDVNDRRSKFNFVNQGSVVSLAGESSKRPIRCPTHLCGRNIAVAALSSHFCFDHPEVPPLNVDFDVSCHLFIDPEMIPYNYGRCVAILLIPNKCEAATSVSHASIISINKVKNSLPLVVMASKLDCSTSNQSNIGGIHEETQSESLNHGDFQSSATQNSREKQHSPLDFSCFINTNTDLTNGKSRLLVIWLAGVDMSSSMYTTIQVTEKHTNMRSVIYTGPVMSLRVSQNTSKVFEQGDCLVIHPGILENIIGDKGGFDLHVMVH